MERLADISQFEAIGNTGTNFYSSLGVFNDVDDITKFEEAATKLMQCFDHAATVTKKYQKLNKKFVAVQRECVAAKSFYDEALTKIDRYKNSYTRIAKKLSKEMGDSFDNNSEVRKIRKDVTKKEENFQKLID